MTAAWRALLAALALLAVPAAAAPFDGTVAAAGREAFSQPVPGLSDGERASFFRGRALFQQSWVIAPARDASVGLGPLYNRLACVSCHPKNGRGRAPDAAQARVHSMLLRLSLDGTDAHGGPRPHPVYGDQLSEQGIPGVPGEGLFSLNWIEFNDRLPDGTVVPMRKPEVVVHDLNYGPLGEVRLSARVAPPVFGLGLLQSVAAADVQALARERKPDGVKGHPNRVWNAESGRMELGRLSLKANVATLRAQISSAMLGDLGITSARHPQENCTPAQRACRAAPSGGQPELSRAQLDDMDFYLQHLAAPARRDAGAPEVLRGERLFTEIGCESCHRATLRTAPAAASPHLSGIELHPYTDLLVHDMGALLADHRPDYLASGREWRTPPLWGIGLTELVGEYQSYLHDGRARTLIEAILWHDGEARTSRERFAALPAADRAALERFLQSL